MDEKRLAFRNNLTAFLVCSVVFSVVYNFAAWFTSNLSFVPSFVFDFEKLIPFSSWSILPYLTSGLGFCLVFFLCKTKEELLILTKRMLFVTIVAGLCFLLFPLKFSFPKPEIDNPVLRFLFNFLQAIDSPFNQSPSLHVVFALLFWTVFRKLKSKWRTFVMIWLFILALSTLTTFQHHVIDVITGGILAHLSFVVFPFQKNNFKFRNFQVANIYFLIGWMMILLSALTSQFFSNYFLIILWISLILFLIGYHYQKNNVHFLKDETGRISVLKKIFYLPYLLMYWFFWKFLRKNTKPAEIIDGLYISSKLDDAESEKFNLNKNTFVYDLSAELEENKLIREKSFYSFVPFLDISNFEEERTSNLVLKIVENFRELAPDGKILIHCTMGFTRSAVISILVVKKILSLPLAEAISKVTTANKNSVIHQYLQDFLKTINI